MSPEHRRVRRRRAAGWRRHGARRSRTHVRAIKGNRQGAAQVNLTEQLAAAVQQLKEVEKQIPEAVRLLYERLVQARGADALASAVNDICRACATAITAQMHNELLVGNFVFCKNCGRLLYTPE